eukprot:4968803-Prymnesium_polylepis.1
MYAGVREVQIPLTLAAFSLREQAARYEETLSIDIRSLSADVAQTALLKVELAVQAWTSYVVWGDIRWDAS